MQTRYLSDAVFAAALNKIRKHEGYARGIAEENRRRERRSTHLPDFLSVQRPAFWSFRPGFDPYHVRKHAFKIGTSLARSLAEGSYSPHRPSGFRVPKDDGSTRLVTTFEIADEVVSARLFHSLTRKNRPRFSARSYAYRPDLSPHDAVEYIASEFKAHTRLFVAEFDFSKFFDNIEHSHIRHVLNETNITATPSERRALDAFLLAPNPYERYSELSETAPARSKGLPQGTSVSLFLANLAASPLDRRLERLGVNFARYADDTLIWSEDYGQINDAVSALHETAIEIGAPINFRKSPGIRLLVPEDTKESEMPRIFGVNFLGHSISLSKVSMKKTSAEKFKAHVTRLIYDNLLREPLVGQVRSNRIGILDWDYTVLVSQLRRYLYGPLSERQVRAFVLKEDAPARFEGLMSFYPLIDDEVQLKSLDGWLITQITLALKKRRALLGMTTVTPYPWGASRTDLQNGIAALSAGGRVYDLRIPSISRISKILRAVLAAYGPSSIKRYDPYMYDE